MVDTVQFTFPLAMASSCKECGSAVTATKWGWWPRLCLANTTQLVADILDAVGADGPLVGDRSMKMWLGIGLDADRDVWFDEVVETW